MLSDGDEKHIIFIYGYEYVNSYGISLQGKKEKVCSDILYIVNVSKTLDFGETNFYSIPVENIDKLLPLLEEIPPDEIREEMSDILQILNGEITYLSNRFNALSKITSSFNYSVNNGDNKQANLVIGNGEEGIAHIVLNTLNDTSIKLGEDDIEKVGNALMDIIIQNNGINVENKDETEQLRKDIEFKIIESLPVDLRTGDINININCILQEIKRYQDKKRDKENGEF